MPFGLTRLIPTRVARGAGTASADTAGTTYTVSGLKVGSSAILYGNGTQIATATVDGTGKATWALGSKPAVGTIITYNGVIVGSGGTVTAPPVTPSVLSISGANGTASVGDTLSFTPTISGGTAPYNVTATGLAPGRAIQSATTGLTTGAYTTAGSYSETYTVTDAAGATASFTRSVVVAAASLTVTTTTLASDKENPTTADTVTLTATIAPSGATGTVTFRDGGASIGTGPLSGGTATYAGSLTAGSHNLTASYPGDVNFAASSSSVLALTVTDALGGVPSNALTYGGEPLTYGGEIMTYGAAA